EMNYDKALQYYQKTCNENDAMGCYDVGKFYQQGIAVKQNQNTANEYYDKSCKLGSVLSCDKLKTK
ncbi:MAG: sel1 repeat family protein, partial [Neisseriaceae bacterium]|nr:sel1 repeat family protein [Neisseriaceae bacterium]